MAGDRVEDNLNPVGAAHSGFSTLLRTPNSLSQETKAAFGAQAGEERLREVAVQSGLTHVRRVAETPFNLVLGVRPKAKASARSSCRSRRRSAVGHGRGGHRSSGSGVASDHHLRNQVADHIGGSGSATGRQLRSRSVT